MMQEGLTRSSVKTALVLGLRLAMLAGTLVLMTRVLGPSSYGAYVSAATLAVLMGLLSSVGAGYIVMIRVAGGYGSPGESWRYAWPLTTLVGGALALVYCIVAKGLVGTSITLADLGLIAASELVAIPLIAMLGSIFQAIHRVPTGQLLQMIPIIYRVAASGICLLIPATHSIHPFIVGQAIATWLAFFTAIAAANRALALRWAPRRPTRREWQMGTGYAAMNIVAANPAEVDKVIAPILLDQHAAGIYSAAARVMNAAVAPVTAVLLTSQPRLFARKGPELRMLARNVAAASFAIGTAASVALNVASPLVVSLLGPSFEAVRLLLPWVTVALPFLCTRLAAGTVLVALGRPMERLAFELGGIGLLVAMLSFGAANGGPKGMAIALSLSEALISAAGWIRIRAILDRQSAKLS